jgi:hypothetical protein
MNKQFWYQSARETVDDLIDLQFESILPEGHRQLARIWQYLRDQEVVAIQQSMKTASGKPSVAFKFGATPAIGFGATD